MLLSPFIEQTSTSMRTMERLYLKTSAFITPIPRRLDRAYTMGQCLLRQIVFLRDIDCVKQQMAME